MLSGTTFAGATPPLTPIALCDPQPLLAEGVRAVLAAHSEFELVFVARTIDDLRARMRWLQPKVILLDRMGSPEILASWLADTAGFAATVLWSSQLSEPDIVRCLRMGVKAILPKSADADCLLQCLRAAAAGQTWIEESSGLGAFDNRYPRSALTVREQQVLLLVEQGLKNRDIAQELCIQPGTVKIHLKHIFEKTGVRGRYGLALSGLRTRAAATFPRAHEATV